MSAESSIYAVVMAGGSGTRFWPLSRRLLPKQFLKIGGDRSLIAETMSRLDVLASWDQRFIVAGSQHVARIREHCPDLPQQNLLVEPCARNTAPCVALAAAHIAERDPNGIMILLPADHHIADVKAFQRALTVAVEGAREGKMMTLGVIPTRAETGYGYIKYPGGGHANESRLPVERFVEKPPQRIAERYVSSGEYLWNSGVFIFSVSRILSELKAQLPDLTEKMAPVREAIAAKQDKTYEEALDLAFESIRGVSIDVGVMEGAREIEVIPLKVGWSDVGHWGALHEVSERDEQGNVFMGHPSHCAIDSRDVTIHSERFTAVIGLEGVVVVNTEDATLVCDQSRSQEVRQVIEHLSHHDLESLL